MKINGVILLAALAITASGCQRALKAETTTNTNANATAASVIAQNSSQLMRFPDVVGIYEGLMPDGKTHCITVMMSKQNAETVKLLPSTLGGYPVRVEVTGQIKPVGK